MSWFDATGLANIAKSALKEAQKTIDKALDIREEDQSETFYNDKKTESSSTKDSVVLEDLKCCQDVSSGSVEEKDLKNHLVKSGAMPTSGWGSFSGSFFQIENPHEVSKPLLISTQPQKFSLLQSSNKKEGAQVTGTDSNEWHTDVSIKKYGLSEENAKKENINSNSLVEKKNEPAPKFNESENNKKDVISVIHPTELKGDEGSYFLAEEKVTRRPKGRRNSSNRNSYVSNRQSVLSNESDGKKSSDSVEVLESLSCTTSPDTELPSISASSSLGLPISSSCTDSVEVIDSLTSPSSIEVIIEGTGSGRNTQSSCLSSPKDENIVNPNLAGTKFISSPISSLNDISPESFEVIPDLSEYDEDLSIAESYTSASESTGPTILEPSYQYSYRMGESFTDLSQASSKFCSGDSTPDVITKLSLTNKSSSDILSESIHEVHNSEAFESVLNKSVESKKNLVCYEKSSQKCSTPDPQLSETSPDFLGKILQSPQEGSVHKISAKLDDRKGDDVWYKKLDLMKSEVRNTSLKKEFDEGETIFQGSDKSDTFSSEEICGSVSSYSDSRTVLANDSSCDEIALESSSEEVGNTNLTEINNDFRIRGKLGNNGSQNHSYYVKNLLSEAMGEVSGTRETSPTLSEKSRSDLIKVGSEQTSGHTSGDELETTTSSDIEIISSPNGDSSSTTSRHSPAKLLHHNSRSRLSLTAVDVLGKPAQNKSKGHHREPSEASSFCSEDNTSEVEKLTKRVSELTEILEARESRLNDLRKLNLEMQEKNQELKKEMELAKKGFFATVSGLEAETEKDKLIKELKEEGEKLSKKELKQATLIKTLRAQEKSQQALIEDSKSQVQNLKKLLDECKQELKAKKESEKLLNESIQQMNKKITRQDEEIANLMNQLEKAVVKAEEMKYLLENKEVELKSCKELLAAEDFELQDAKSIAESKTKQLEKLKVFQESAELELEDMRQQLTNSEKLYTELEKSNKKEKNELMRKLQEAEGRNEELAEIVSKATKPLFRQIEVLQAAMANERETWEKQERNLIQKLEEAEGLLSSLKYQEKNLKQEVIELKTKINNLEEELKISNQELASWKYQVNFLSKQLQDTNETLGSGRETWEKQKDVLESHLNELKGEVATLEHQLLTERANIEVERRRTATFQEQLKEKEAHPPNKGDLNSPRSSPTLSFGRVSLSESLSSSVWPQFCEDGIETGSVLGRSSNVYDNLKIGTTASLIESLQAQLKMKDGEISLLQWELQRKDAERGALTDELSSLTLKLDEAEKKLTDGEVVNQNLKELQTNYDALLEMYGEKVEEVEELQLDLQDVKEMYKSQIDQLLKKEKQDVSS